MNAESTRERRRSLLDRIEWLGNQLPEPAILFALLALVVVLVSALGSALDWQVQPVRPVVATTEMVAADGSVQQVPRTDAEGRPQLDLVASGAPIEPRSLLSTDGIYWMMSSALRNFTTQPALGLIFVAVLGIGIAEKFGFFAALMRFLAFLTPRRWMTPMVVFIGANSAVASDAGYIILPPLAAALYLAMGRHPVAGLAAAFCGVAGGFGGGLFPAGSDGALAGFAQDAARVVEPHYTVNILHNWYFKIASALLVTAVGWYVTDRIVEPRLQRTAPPDGTGEAQTDMRLAPRERRALTGALAAMGAVGALIVAMIVLPSMPLHGPGQPRLPNDRVLAHIPVQVAPEGSPIAAPAHDVLAREPLVVTEAAQAGRLVENPGPRWSHVIVPLIFLLFAVPGVVYGAMTGVLRGQGDLNEALNHGIRTLAPVLVMLFFLAQFTSYFSYSHLDRMMAYAGGSLLVAADLPVAVLLVAFVAVVIGGDFAMSGLISKFGVLAPIFVPMFMLVGISPELTTAAYRIGDSVVNIVTPLNNYVPIIVAVLMKYRKDAGIGTLIALMVPYSLALGAAWTAFLLLWVAVGIPLGPEGPLWFVPSSE
jgi:aminobenzoyl-glutamate transport protein